MFAIKLKDGSVREFESQKNGLEIATSISTSLAKDAVALKVDGEMTDLTASVPHGSVIEIVRRNDPDALELLRHDAAHVLAEAAKELYPDLQVTIGPAIENGFYYDFYREIPFTPDDLSKLEARMHEIVKRDEPIVRTEMPREEAIKFFESIGEKFKAEIIRDIPEGQIISFYRQGDFIDLCRGPHLPSTGRLGKAFKLMSVAGSYWRGDHRNERLQRIYGTAWATEQQLKDYLMQLEEAEKRDHRRLGNELDLFHLQEEAPGSVFWHPKGWTVYLLLENFMRKRLEKGDYVEVKTPQILDSSFWGASGHWEKFRENMFVVESEEKTMAVKPMSCPCHVQIFKQGIKSYRDLPLRMAEFGACHRNEPSGALHGIMRVRAFTQDDGHVFCTPEQIVSETKLFCDSLKEVYAALGFNDIRIKFSDRPEKRAGADEIWDQAEGALKEAAIASGLDFTLNPGEGAFYGPKLEFVLRDAIGREWQCGTLQADFVLPERLDASYIAEDGKKHRPVMLHRAILGSFERFIGILIEHYAGKLPLWLAPVQVCVATITSEADSYGQKVVDQLQAQGIRAILDSRNEKINYKVREHSVKKVPLIFVVGKREEEESTVAIRRLGTQDQQVLHLAEAITMVVKESKEP
ncbi:threonine--tRNA ligase [Candidatus Odyssella acanthamoebae]|uniref:Threonine--tRNA ligase n=1 Tax=Candidatus Odyssella acanthamoebae TaxID=91604 RepID=A0A077AXP7_9PROT|nr:threonine--tRNA ligase [Candidatus Paracaedibacter acanthamoebae]AIK96403.1 threonine--tRNA ligase [Candidatus Paracaedibacter acanthamoebae]